MRTAKDIMEQSFKEALVIVEKQSPSGDRGANAIAASNLAMAIFSYEAEMEAMKDAHQQMDDEDDELDIDDRGGV